MASQRSDLISTLAQIAVIWILSDLGFYLLIPAFGVGTSYNSASIAVTLYYVFWVGIAVITFLLYTLDSTGPAPPFHKQHLFFTLPIVVTVKSADSASHWPLSAS